MTKSDTMLEVCISHCPAEAYIKKLGYQICPWFRYTKETIMEVFANAAGLKFTLEFYDEKTGAAKYRFEK